MKNFTVYHHKNLGKYIAVKQGFSWAGLLLGTLWTLYKRLWGLTLIMVLVNTSTTLIAGDNESLMVMSNLIAVVLGLAVGYLGNRAYGESLERKGYVVVSYDVCANNKEHAISKVLV